jgi:hypothetical protein
VTRVHCKRAFNNEKDDSGISLSSQVLHQSHLLKARLQHIIVEKMRGLHVHVLELLYIFCFGGQVTVP